MARKGTAKADEEQSFRPSPADANLRSDSSRPAVTLLGYFANARKSRLEITGLGHPIRARNRFSDVVTFRFSSYAKTNITYAFNVVLNVYESG